jgi:alkylation response protein AidB-like acyl-CoA dehydrogenase
VRFDFTAEQLMVRDTVREFVDAEIRPRVKQYEANSEFPADIVKKLGELGLAAMTLPEEHGGGGSDTTTYCLAIEELARVDPSTAVTLSVNNSVCCAPINAFGSDELKARYLPRLARAEIIGGFALTEPGAGSDAANLTTRAVRDGEHYVLNGTKAWITNAGVGGAFVTIAKTDPDAGAAGLTAFVVDSDTPGFRVGKLEDKMGLRASATAQLIYEDCRVPAQNLLGEEGMGLRIALETLDGARIGVAAQSIGIAQGAFDEARRYAKSRETFGKAIAQHQAISFMLADMATEIEAARVLTLRAAWLKDQQRPFKVEAAQAKLYASEMCNRVAYNAVQIHGGYGYSKDYAVERMYRDARVTTLYEGTSEIQRFVIARALLAAND